MLALARSCRALAAAGSGKVSNGKLQAGAKAMAYVQWFATGPRSR